MTNIMNAIRMAVIAAAILVGSNVFGQNLYVNGGVYALNGQLSGGYGNSLNGSLNGAIGIYNYTTGFASIALGSENGVRGDQSFSAGVGNASNGFRSISVGSANVANNTCASAFGFGSTAVGDYAMTLGMGVISQSFATVVVGAYNAPVANPNATAWVPTDPIFVVGNGSSSTTKSNAITVLKNGTILIHPQGDLSMGAYTSGSQP